QGDWKLIYYYETGAKELFNLKDDLGEATNLALTNPEKVNELSTKLGKFLRKSGGQRPSFKATGKPAPWPDETF
ncbi:MAG: sulfatase, partial [Macellibacteroides sp.]